MTNLFIWAFSVSVLVASYLFATYRRAVRHKETKKRVVVPTVPATKPKPIPRWRIANRRVGDHHAILNKPHFDIILRGFACSRDVQGFVYRLTRNLYCSRWAAIHTQIRAKDWKFHPVIYVYGLDHNVVRVVDGMYGIRYIDGDGFIHEIP